MRVLVTGGNRGIGGAITQRLVHDGHDVMALARTDASFADKADEETRYKKLCADLSNQAAVDDLPRRVHREGFRPEVLVLNAGCFFEESLQNSTLEHINAQIQVNLVSQIQLIRGFAEDLKSAPRSRIVIIGSTSAFEAYAYGPVYSITKWALRGLAENARAELRPSKVGVTLIHPGGTWTDLWEGAELPRNRLLEPSDIASMVAALLTLSEQASVDELIIRPVEGDFHE